MNKLKGNKKKGRVIVRNLSFKATEDVLRSKFSKFGEISEIVIPKKPDGKMYGFGFVQFEKTASAIKAINALNAKEILGRPVAIDFAIPKDRFKQLKNQRPDAEQKETKHLNENNNRSVKSKDISNEDNDSDEATSIAKRETKQPKPNDDSSVDDSDSKDNPTNKKRNYSNSSNIDDTEDSSSNDENSSDDEESSSDDEERNSINKKRKIKQSKTNNNNTDDDSEDEDNHLNTKKKIKKSVSNEEMPLNEKKKLSRPSDVGEGKTLFIRNLSFDTTAEELKEAMSKYGDTKYCLLCKDPLTEYPKGTGFVQFVNKEDAEKCLEQSCAKDTQIVLGGRVLNIVLAITHEDIKKQKEARIKKGKDNRNLKLETEGLIRPGSEAAEGVSQADLTKRLQLERYKRKLLKNLNYFISPVRLCVHNIPLHFNDKKLRKVFLKAAGSGAVITETRIMRNLKKLDDKGVGLSKGFAFISFTKHEDALAALRELNNNPDTFSPHKRPIVEFSMENRSILNAKKRQIERQNKRPFQQKKTDNNSNADNLKMQEKKKFPGSKGKKFSKPFKPNKVGNQPPNKKKLKYKKQAEKFQGNIIKKEKKKFKGYDKKKKNLKVNAF